MKIQTNFLACVLLSILGVHPKYLLYYPVLPPLLLSTLYSVLLQPYTAHYLPAALEKTKCQGWGTPQLPLEPLHRFSVPSGPAENTRGNIQQGTGTSAAPIHPSFSIFPIVCLSSISVHLNVGLSNC